MTNAVLLVKPRAMTANAREALQVGASAAGCTVDRRTLIKLLNDALATELVCVLRYRRHHFMARGIHSQGVAQEFLEHANAELRHADQLAERIVQLGGEPEFSSDTLTSRSHAKYVEGDTLMSMIRVNLVAAGSVLDSYRSLLQYLGDNDSTTQLLLELIVCSGEQHADKLTEFLVTFSRLGASSMWPD